MGNRTVKKKTASVQLHLDWQMPPAALRGPRGGSPWNPDNLGKNLYQYNYSDDELVKVASGVKPYLAGRTLYAFFNNDYHAYAPVNAESFRQMLLER